MMLCAAIHHATCPTPAAIASTTPPPPLDRKKGFYTRAHNKYRVSGLNSDCATSSTDLMLSPALCIRHPSSFRMPAGINGPDRCERTQKDKQSSLFPTRQAAGQATAVPASHAANQSRLGTCRHCSSRRPLPARLQCQPFSPCRLQSSCQPRPWPP